MTGRLRTRSLGSTGIQVSEIGFGAASLGNLYRPTGEDEAREAVARAWERGIRYFDTAPHYGLGLSEQRLGQALAAYPRDEYAISTKVGRLLEPNPRPTTVDTEGFVVPGDMHRVWDFSRDGVRRSLDASLGRLGLDHVDIVYAHDPDQFRQSAAREGLEALGGLRAEGVVGAIGIGTNVTEQLPGLFADGLLDVAMVAGRYTLMDQSALVTALDPASRAGGSIIAVAVFNSGLLSTPRPARDAKYDYGQAPVELIARANQLADICESHGTSLPAAAIAFPLQHPVVASVTLGMRNTSQVDSNLDRYESPIPAALWAELVDAGLMSSASINRQDTCSTR